MFGTDAVLGFIGGDGTPFINDYKIGNQRLGNCPGVCPDTDPSVGGKNNILGFNGNGDNGRTQLLWKRKLDTGDKQGDIVIGKGDINVAWAYNLNQPGPVLNKHDAKGGGSINFFTGGSSIFSVANLKKTHGSLMFIAWCLIIPFGSFVARYLKNKGWWFNVHRGFNTLAMLLMVIAFILAVKFTVAQHFGTWHKGIGIVVMILGFAQPFIGTLADLWFDIKRITDSNTSTPVYPDTVHMILGYGTWLLALANILLGLTAYGAAIGVTVVYIFFAGTIVSILFGYFAYKQILGGDEH